MSRKVRVGSWDNWYTAQNSRQLIDEWLSRLTSTLIERQRSIACTYEVINSLTHEFRRLFGTFLGTT